MNAIAAYSVQAVIAALKPLGITLTIAPGEYIVNFRKGASGTEYRTGDLADALAHGLAMGLPQIKPAPLGPMGSRRGAARAKMYAHNRKVATRRRAKEDASSNSCDKP